MTIGDKIRKAREKRNLTMEELGDLCGTTKQTIFKYETGVITNIPLSRIEKNAEILRVSPAYIMGWEDDPTIIESFEEIPSFDKVPLVCSIACGSPILAEENITDYVDAPGHIHADYALQCRGESMINAGIRDGDIVYIRKQQTVDNGQIAAVVIDGEEATLKRFHYDGKVLILSPANDSFSPMSFFGEEMSRVQVVGLAVAYLHEMK